MIGVPARNRRAERHEATRAEILHHAWELSGRGGLAGLTLRDLAREVGMQAPSLYSYFDSKNAIYDAMFAQGAGEYLAWQKRHAMTGDRLRDLRIQMRSFVEFCVANPVRYQLLFQRTVPGFEPSPESFAVSVEGLEEVRTRLGEMGITDPSALDLLTAIGTGLTDQQISNDPGGDRWIRLIDDAMAMFFHHVTANKGAQP